MTGGSGFIGRPTLSSLVDLSAEVVAIGRTDPRMEGVSFVKCDLLDSAQRRQAIRAVAATHLAHLAWDLRPGEYYSSPRNYEWVAASIGLALEFAEAGGRRIVSSGSCFEYDWSSGDALAEASLLRPQTVYGAAKDVLRRALAGLSEAGGPESAWARLFYLYGPGENSSRLAGAVVSSLLKGQRVATTDGLQQRDYMYVGDAAAALARLVLDDFVGDINVATGAPVPVRTLISSLADEVGRADLVDFGARPPNQGEPAMVAADVSLLEEVLGPQRLTPLSEGAALTVDWWRGQLVV